VTATFLVKLFTGNLLADVPRSCAIGGFFILLFAVVLDDRRLAAEDKPSWSLREFAATFYVDPRTSPDFAWAFASRFLFVLAYAFLATYQAYYLLNKLGSAEADVPQQIFLGTLVQSVLVVSPPSPAAGCPTGPAAEGLRPGRRRSCTASRSSCSPPPPTSTASSSGMAISGLGFGVYVAVDLALVTQVLPDEDTVAKDLGVFNIAGALPFTIAPRSPRPFWPSAAAATASCTRSPGSAPFWGRSPSCPCDGSGEQRQLGGPSAWMGRPAEEVERSGDGDRLTGRAGPRVEGGESRGPEALDRQVDADGELEHGHGEAEQEAGRGDLAPGAEDRRDVRQQDEGPPTRPMIGMTRPTSPDR
jgi:hypothetical protein